MDFIWKCKAASYFVPGVECQMEGYYEEEIENAFMALLLEMKQTKDVLVKEVRKAARNQALTYYEKKKVELLRLEIKSLHKKTNQEEVLTQSDDSSELIGKVLLRFSQEHERLQTKLDKLEEKSQQVLLISNNLDWLLTELKKHTIGDPLNESIQFRGDIFRRLVSRCLVFNDGRIIFEMNVGISREIRFKDIAFVEEKK